MARVGSIVFAFFSLTGCVSRDYVEVYDLPDDGWTRSSSVVFTYRPDSVASLWREDSRASEREWIDIIVRHRGSFDYAELPLEIKGVTADKQYWADTVYVALGEVSGDGDCQWAGRRFSNHYDITRPYRSGIRYNTAAGGGYVVSIRQLTVQDTLQGILAIGIVASGAQAINNVQ